MSLTDRQDLSGFFYLTCLFRVKYNEGMATGYLYDPLYLQHFQSGHIEGPERLAAITRALDETGQRDR